MISCQNFLSIMHIQYIVLDTLGKHVAEFEIDRTILSYLSLRKELLVSDERRFGRTGKQTLILEKPC